MAEARRRSAMQPPSDAYGAGRSGIPVPMSTAKKAPHNTRLSMAGPALRAPPLPPGTNPRQSLYRSQNVNPLLASASKSNYGRTPMSNSTRRGSMWGGVTMPPPPVLQVAKDVRPLRDRQFQTKMRQDIFNWLQETDYDVSMQTLTNITGKDFRGIFQHLVTLLDPFYPFDPKVRFEEEFISSLKSLAYPFVNQLDPKWLAAPASMHSWPSLLGVLHWLVMMGKDLNDIPDEFDDPHHHQALAFDYIGESYDSFLAGTEGVVDHDHALEERYAKKDERVRADLEEKNHLLSLAKAELDKLLSSEAPIEKLKNDNRSLKRDREKFQECIRRWEARKKNLIDTIAQEKAEMSIRTSKLQEIKTEQERLAQVVKEQNLSPEEVIRMNTEHEQLSRNLEDLKHKIAESHQSVMSLEVTVTNRAAAAEEALDAYTNLLAALGLFPPLPPPFQDIDLTLELNTAASNPQHLLSGQDIRRVIKPTLNSVAESKRNERAHVESDRIRVDNELDQLVLEIENLEEEVNDVEKQVVAINEQADDLREAGQQEALVSGAEASRLQRDLAHARTAALANGVGVKSRLQALQIAYREQVEKVARLKDETIRAIVKNSSDIVMFKEEVSAQLNHLRECAETT
ncbi:hypothetical protein EVG20_g3376 [Dentipellis fragilis]|uniref:Kinetochore protein NDC80 n=1 Tax=Dentipellis fragilis TaxID=205917 RepID=A0A4Y9Z240_9AGAM|nr:hypothetical protein EVG20_g3376 [Dentipellis fragilis]